MTTLRKPCENCPWRKDAPRQHWDPTHFVEIWRGCQGDAMHVMLCHKSRVEKSRGGLMPDGSEIALVCQGWARVLGFEAIGVRLAVMNGQLAVEEIEDEDTAELFETFEDMMRANRVPLPPRPVQIQLPGRSRKVRDDAEEELPAAVRDVRRQDDEEVRPRARRPVQAVRRGRPARTRKR